MMPSLRKHAKISRVGQGSLLSLNITSCTHAPLTLQKLIGSRNGAMVRTLLSKARSVSGGDDLFHKGTNTLFFENVSPILPYILLTSKAITVLNLMIVLSLFLCRPGRHFSIKYQTDTQACIRTCATLA